MLSIDDANRSSNDVIMPTKLNVDRTWYGFYGGGLIYCFDAWLDESTSVKAELLNKLFNETISDDQLRNQLETYHYHALHSDLSDNWLRHTFLGQKLRELGFRVFAFLERPRAVNLETLVPTLKCSLLIGQLNPTV